MLNTTLPVFLRQGDGTSSPELLTLFSVILLFAALPWLHVLAIDGLTPTLTAWYSMWTASAYGSNTWKLLCEGLYVETARQPSVPTLLATADRGVVLQRRTVQATTSIGPNCKRLEQEVRERYGDQELADKVVLILKMALGLFAYGQPSVDVEMFCLEASLRFGVPAPYVSIGPRVLTASFGSHSPHLLECGRDIVCSYLADLHTLAVMITRGEANDAPTALYVCDQLLKRPRPYGWLIQLVAFECIAILAVPVVLPGSYQDMPGAALICASLLLTMQLGKVLGIAHLEIMYISFAVGAAAPFVWYYVSNSGQPLCHIGPQYIGPLIIHLPGCQFIWAALELAQGSMVHGTARLVNAMFQVMLMAIFITLGWQIFGRDWARGSASIIPLPGQSSTGPIASLPPSLWCPVPSSIPWYVSQGIWALPLVLFLNVHLNIRLRESLAPIACTLVGTLTNGFLRDGCTAETCSMPVDLRNVLVAFVTASAAEVARAHNPIPQLECRLHACSPPMVTDCIRLPSDCHPIPQVAHFHTGLSSFICIVPALYIFAPGSPAMLALIGQLHRAAGEASYSSTSAYAANVATLWETITMAAVTYMLGVLLASQVRAPLLAHDCHCSP